MINSLTNAILEYDEDKLLRQKYASNTQSNIEDYDLDGYLEKFSVF